MVHMKKMFKKRRREKGVQFHVILLHSKLKCVQKGWTMLT